MDTDIQYFPEAKDIAPHAIAFAELMFAHAGFEAEVRFLQGVITSDPSFGERRSNQWSARRRPECMAKLIKTSLGDHLKEAEPIAKLLTDAIAPCDRCNLLAHGEWWSFDSRTSAIVVRSGTRWDDQPQHVEYTVADIAALVETFETLEAELFKLRRSIEDRRDDVRS